MQWPCGGRLGCDNCIILLKKLEELTAQIKHIQKERNELILFIRYQNQILVQIARQQRQQQASELDLNTSYLQYPQTTREKTQSLQMQFTPLNSNKKLFEKSEIDRFVQKVEVLLKKAEQREISHLKKQLIAEKKSNEELIKQIKVYASKQKENLIRQLELKNLSLQQKLENLQIELIDIKIANRQYQKLIEYMKQEHLRQLQEILSSNGQVQDVQGLQNDQQKSNIELQTYNLDKDKKENYVLKSQKQFNEQEQKGQKNWDEMSDPNQNAEVNQKSNDQQGEQVKQNQRGSELVSCNRQ